MKNVFMLLILLFPLTTCEKLEEWRKQNALRRLTPKQPTEDDIENWKERLSLTEAEIVDMDRKIRELVKKTRVAGSISWRIARAFVRIGNYELGSKYYTEALTENAGENPPQADVHRFESAIPYFEKTLIYRPLDETLLFETGLAYANAARDKGWEKQRREMAVTIFTELIRKNPKDTRYPYQLALIYFDSSMTDAIIEGIQPQGYNDQEKALLLLDSILKKEPNSVPVRFAKANFMYRLGKVDNARNEYETIRILMENMSKKGEIGDLSKNPSYKNVINNLKIIGEKTNF
ncbi:MAG: tetratricopeptide repeat protein [Leptospiraceae bacterium]|nr:tetratricopeptide repeat protein [Leptospiraceae bacterium]